MRPHHPIPLGEIHRERPFLGWTILSQRSKEFDFYFHIRLTIDVPGRSPELRTALDHAAHQKLMSQEPVDHRTGIKPAPTKGDAVGGVREVLSRF